MYIFYYCTFIVVNNGIDSSIVVTFILHIETSFWFMELVLYLFYIIAILLFLPNPIFVNRVFYCQKLISTIKFYLTRRKISSELTIYNTFWIYITNQNSEELIVLVGEFHKIRVL